VKKHAPAGRMAAAGRPSPAGRTIAKGRVAPARNPVGVRRSGTLHERKQELVREELSRAAWDLFTHKGYEKTTVAEIARAAGVSRRTFFRYHASKEDVLVATSDAFAQAMLDAVAARPVSEAPLVAIRHALVHVLEQEAERPDFMKGIIRLLRESPALRRAMLDRHARMEERLAALLADRLRIDPERDSTPALLAFLARAFFDTAFNVWYDQDRKDVAGLVDELFAKLRALTRTL
jgi:AcrR family transcriptional regulator